MLAEGQQLVGEGEGPEVDRSVDGDDLWHRLRSLPVGVQLRRHLAGLPAFAQCGRGDLRRASRWGDLIEVEPGRALLHEDGGNFWFFVVISGQVRLTRRGQPVATIGPGGHFGEWAVVGLHPQPATATTTRPSILFVLGRRYVVSLLFSSAAFQRALFPDVDPAEYAAFARRMHEQARVEWIRLAPPLPPPELKSRRAGPSSEEWLGPRPGRMLSLGEAAAVLMKAPAPYQPIAQPVTSFHRGRWTLGAAAVVAVVLAAVLFLYHPPRAVITGGRPIDVTNDITITGIPAHHPTARYLLLLVHVRRPRLAGLIAATLRGQTTVGLNSYQSSRAGRESATRVGRQQYLDSQQVAIAVALAMSGTDRGRAPVVLVRDRGLVGPSAGLVYALEISDMLSRDGFGAGRVVAATGALDPDGTVTEVGWIDLKSSEAARAHAGVLLVPAGQIGLVHAGPTRAGPTRAGSVRGVNTLRQAVDALTKQGS